MPTILHKMARLISPAHALDSCKAGDDITSALLYGSTLPARLFLSFSAMLVGAGYLLGVPGWWTSPIYKGVVQIMPMSWWGWIYLSAGLVGCWRVVSPRSRPFLAYFVNAYVLAAWSAGWVPRLLIGWESFFSLYTPIVAGALWCLVRTEATARDTRTA